MTIVRRTLSRGEKELEYYGDGPTVLVVHGGPGMDFSYMRDGLVPLADRFRLHFYEQLPVRDEDARDVTAQDQVDELTDVIRLLAGDGDGVRILAHSWGAYLALESLRGKARAHVSHLVLANPVPLTWSRLGEAAERMTVRLQEEHVDEMARLEALGTEEAGVELVQLISYAYLAPANRSTIKLAVSRYNPAVNERILSTVENYDQTALAPALDEISLTCIFGDGDFIGPEGTAEVNARGRVVILSDCGHFPFQEAPEALRSVLIQALT